MSFKIFFAIFHILRAPLYPIIDYEKIQYKKVQKTYKKIQKSTKSQNRGFFTKFLNFVL